MTTTLALTFDDVLGSQPVPVARCGRAGGNGPILGAAGRGRQYRGRELLRPGAAPPGQQLDLPWERDGVDAAPSAVADGVPAGGGVGGAEQRSVGGRARAGVTGVGPAGAGAAGTGATGVGSAGVGAAGVGRSGARASGTRGTAAAAGVGEGSSGGAAGAAGSGPRSRPPGPRRPAPRPGTVPTPRAAVGLLRQATEGVAEAHGLPDPLRRYPAAYLAALRAAAAVLAVRAAPAPKRRASRSVWSLLADVAPEFTEWAAFFASCSATRSAAEAGIARLVGQRDADDLLRQTEQFVGLVGEKVVAAA